MSAQILHKLKITKQMQRQMEKFKSDNAAYQEQNHDLREKLQVAEKTIEFLKSSDTSENKTEITRLSFDKQALETKMRKYAVRCQNLEDERYKIRSVLQSKKIPVSETDSLGDLVGALGDRITSLEEECCAMSRSENQASSYLVEIEKLRHHNQSLQSQVSDYRKKLDQVSRTEIQLKEDIRALKQQVESLQVEVQASHAAASEIEQKCNRKYQRLEQDQLQLVQALKTKKEELAKYKAEVKANRLKSAVPASTAKSGPSPSVSKKGTNDQQDAVPLVGKSAPSPSLVNLENSVNGAGKVSVDAASRRAAGSARKQPLGPRTRAPGLGESHPTGDENIQEGECKQS